MAGEIERTSIDAHRVGTGCDRLARRGVRGHGQDGKLYMNGDESNGDALVIDASNGKLLRTVPGVFADNLLAVE